MSQTQRYVNKGKCAVCDVLCLRPSGTSTKASVLYVTCNVSDPVVRQQRQVCCMWRLMSQTQRYVNKGKCAVCDVVLCLRPSGTSTKASVLYVTCNVSDPVVRQQRQVCCMWRLMSQTQRYVNKGKCAVCDELCLRPSGTSTTASVLYVTCNVSDPVVRQQRQVCCMWRLMSQTQRYVNKGKCAVCDVVLCLRPSGTSTKASVLYVTCNVSDPVVRQQRQVCCMWRLMSQTQRYVNNGKCAVCDVLCLRPSGTSTTASVLYVTCYVSDPAVRQQRQVCCMWRCVMSQTQRYVNNGKCAVCDVVLCLRPSGTSTTASVVYVTLCYVSDPAVRQQRQVCCMWRCVMSQTQRYVNNGKCAVCDVVLWLRPSGTSTTASVVYVTLCYVSDPAVRQQRQVCCMWRCVMSQTQWYVNNGKCGVCDVICLRPSGTSTTASVLYVTLCYVSDTAVRQQRQVCCMWRLMSQTQRYVNKGKCAVCDVVLCLRPSGTSTKASVLYVTCNVSDPVVRQQRQVCCMWRLMSQTQRYVNKGKCAVCDELCLRPSGTSTTASVLYVTCNVSDPVVRQQRQVCCMWRLMSQTQRYVNKGKCAVCDVVLCLRPSGTSTKASVLYVTCNVSDPVVRQQRQVCCMWRLMSQTQRYVNNGKCAVCDVVLCLRPSGTSTTASVLYVTLCYVSDPAVRQQRQVCCMWRCVMSQTQWYVNNGKCAVCDVLCLRPSGTSTTASVLYVTLCYVSDPAVRQQRQVCCMWRVMSETQRYVNNGKCAVCDVVLCLRHSGTSTKASVLYVTCYVSDPAVRQQRQVWCMWRVMSQTQRYVNSGKCAVCDVVLWQVCCMWRVSDPAVRQQRQVCCMWRVLCLRPSGTSTTASVLYVTCYVYVSDPAVRQQRQVSDTAVRQQRQVCCMWRCVMSQTQRYVNNGKCGVCDVVLCLRPSGTSTTASVLYVTLCCMWRVMSQTQRYVNNGKCAVCLRPSGTSTTASVWRVCDVCMSQTQRYVNNGKCAVCDVVMSQKVVYVTLCYVSDPAVRQQRQVCCMWRCVMSQTQRYVNNGKCAVCDVCYVSDPVVRQQRQVCCMWRCVMSQTQRYVNNGKCAVCDVVMSQTQWYVNNGKCAVCDV